MQIVILNNESSKEELIVTSKDTDIVRINEAHQLKQYHQADAFIDLSFDNKKGRIDLLKSLSRLVIINSVITTLSETDPSFVRINAWPAFLQSSIIEGSSVDESAKVMAGQVLHHFNKKIEWLPDNPGFIAPRVISMIINEAYFALAEGVSTKEEIDIAMKLGTNYPYGPFAWSEMIGLKNIAALLTKLSRQQKRYQPCPLLLSECELL